MHRSFILITAAKNEEAYIGETLASVVRQTIHPIAWFIMDDGSTDRTAAIVEEFAARHPFIRLQRVGAGERRNFGAQYRAVQAAYELAKRLEFDFMGIHDADISPQQNNYYDLLLNKFQDMPRLGISGGYVYERNREGKWRGRPDNSENSVAGGIQMFRRACFEQIGGYNPLPYGGADWLAQLDAAMAGWESIAHPELPVLHYRPTSTAGGWMRGQFHLGLMDASFGSHPLFEAFKCARRVGIKPFVIASIVRFSGFAWWKMTGQKPLIQPGKVQFLRKTQLLKIRTSIPFLRP
jgi:glycosyltransferase involved in cell wall biosynthesis